MILILTSSIKEKEVQSVSRIFPLEIIKTAAKKSLQGLGQKIKSSSKLPSSTLFKLKLTCPGGVGRVLFLLNTEQNKTILVMVRMKKDKKIGENMSIVNQKLKNTLNKNLDLIISDLENGRYQEFDLS